MNFLPLLLPTIIKTVLPEVVNVGRGLAARRQGTQYVPVQREQKTFKGYRTITLAGVYVVAWLLLTFGVPIPENIFDVLAFLMTGTLGLKAVR